MGQILTRGILLFQRRIIEVVKERDSRPGVGTLKVGIALRVKGPLCNVREVAVSLILSLL